MKIRMLTSLAGADAEGRVFSYSTGDELDVEPETAKRYLESEQAEAVAVKPTQRAEKRVTAKTETRG